MEANSGMNTGANRSHLVSPLITNRLENMVIRISPTSAAVGPMLKSLRNCPPAAPIISPMWLSENT